MTRRLFVAAGGGGDVIAATMLAARDAGAERVAVATLSWDRLIIDPLPGPRTVPDFVGLGQPAGGVFEVGPETTMRVPAGSTLPGLAAALPARLFLLDPTAGAAGLATQTAAIAAWVGAEELVVVDVGGDIIAVGDEPGLRSPLADTLVLAGCTRTGLPTSVLLCGPGLDGELTAAEVFARCAALEARDCPPLTRAQAEPFVPLLDWHPSEATGLLIRAACGARGTVEVRDAGMVVPLTERSAAVYAIDAEKTGTQSVLFGPFARSRSLADAEDALRAVRGSTEIDYERAKSARPAVTAVPADPDDLLAAVDRLTDEAKARGADYMTLRRLTELLRLRGAAAAGLPALLRQRRPDRCDPPLWHVAG